MMSMKKRRRDERKSGKRSAGIVMAWMIVSVVVMASIPLATATITSFTITPDTGYVGQQSGYDVFLSSDVNWTSECTTIAAGFSVVPPTTSGVQLVRVELWDESGYWGYVNFESGGDPATQVLVTVDDGGTILTATQTIDYTPGASSYIPSPGGASDMTVLWPTDTADGYICFNLSLEMRNISVAYSPFIKNPTTPGVYCFNATTYIDQREEVGNETACVRIIPLPLPAFSTFGLAALVGIMSVVLGLVTVRRKR